MKIDHKKTETLRKILLHLNEYEDLEKMDILCQMSIKLYIIQFNDKDLFIETLSTIYDDLEENANQMGII
jgi:hypothetical protein